MEKKNFKNVLMKKTNNNEAIRVHAIINLIIFIIINIFYQIKTNTLFDSFYFQHLSNITLKIKGIGESYIFGHEQYHNFTQINYLKDVYINGERQETIEYKYYFNQINNTVELIWNDGIKDCKNMFRSCSNITEINMSYFDTSLVTNMYCMFQWCSSLTLLDLTNFNTSLVQDMYGMFYSCSSLTSLDLSYFNTSLVTSMLFMFHSCSKLTSLNLSHFNTSLVIDMFCMFQWCSSLTLLDLTNFNTSLVQDMYGMFYSCSSLTSLDLSYFNTSQAINMGFMFNGCSSLTSLDLSHFNTSLVISMDFMFNYCSKLTTLNLSHFNTSLVIDMYCMFNGCSSLTLLDLSNFNTSLVTNMNSMFYNCKNLEFINLNNFDERSLLDSTDNYQDMFKNVPENVVVCINEPLPQSKILPQIKKKNCYVIDCTDNWKSKQKKLTNGNQCLENIENMDITTQYKCKNNIKYTENIYISNTIEFLFEDKSTEFNIYKCKLDECLSCTPESAIKELCIQCNTNYYPKESDSLNIKGYIKCYQNPEGYYLDNGIYKQCYDTCKTCRISGNNIHHNCIECKDNFPYFVNNNDNNDNNYINCFEYSHVDEPVNIDINNIIKKLLEIEKNKTGIWSNEEEIEFYNNLTEIIEKLFTENYYKSQLDNGYDEYIKTEKILWTFTTVDYQKSNINSNMTIVDMENCEDLLKNEYNISALYMKKLDIVQEGMKTVKVEYDIYGNLSGTKLTKLNLTACENNKISIYIPYAINENVDEYNSSSGYYNDVCYTTTSKYGTDITLKDRQKNYIEEDKVICQEDCDFAKYNNEYSKAKCSCNVKKSSESIKDMAIDKAKIVYDNFKDVKNLINYKFLICYKILLKKESIIKNIGSYLLAAVMLFHIIAIFIFCIKQFSLIKKKIKDIISGIKGNKKIGEDKKRKNEKSRTQIRNNKNANINFIKNSDIRKLNKSKTINKKALLKINNHKKNKLRKIQNDKIKKNNSKNINNITTNVLSKNNNKQKKINFNTIKNKQNEIEKIKNIMKYTDSEINILPYNLAIQSDKRSYCNYYISLLRTKHDLIFAFSNKDYNSIIIKFDLFFIGFTIDYIVNALFFNDDTMHQFYKNRGKYDILTQLPIIAYSTFISMILKTPLSLLALSNDAIINFKQNKSKINLMKREHELINKLIIKFIFYFIVSFLLIGAFWYYISMFCIIYKNTQIHLLKDTVTSFGLSLIIPFGINLLPGICRIPALSNKKNKRKCLYNFSKFLQMF